MKHGYSRGGRARFGGLIFILCLCAAGFARGESKFDTSKVDSALGRSGIWIQGLYSVFFPRPELKLVLQRVQLASSIHAVSFMTNEHPRVFFVHYWKISTAQDEADGLKAALTAVHVRKN